ncbi:MAG: DNA/RNA non-specific endonuclease [Moorea sp. SIO3C2]|nr:DNA/RNA non-specific endonuclease [Moorena sp. SIO3C2]NES80749.1 DNA/RNA non-specific endonuclease [Moorena sp. SIO2B7]
MKRIFLIVVAIAWLGLVFFTPKVEALNLPECVLNDCNCSDFATQPEAQAVFNVFVKDFFRLDKDGDGIVCTSLPGTPKTEKVEPEASELSQPKSLSKLVLKQIKFGNPSDADTDLNNYLIPKEQFVISYNCSRNLANWVSWMVDASYLGDVERADDFRPDPDLPCYQPTPRDYRRSGYDRGHIAPSADRDSNKEDNSATFYMSNIMPQSPSNNREVWRELEGYERDIITELGNKAVYIVAGPLGNIGTIGNGVTVPESTWKVILVAGANGSPSQTIAVNIPNNESVKNTDWQDYLTTVNRIEKLTGYDFFKELPDEIEEVLESKVYQQ